MNANIYELSDYHHHYYYFFSLIINNKTLFSHNAYIHLTHITMSKKKKTKKRKIDIDSLTRLLKKYK